MVCGEGSRDAPGRCSGTLALMVAFGLVSTGCVTLHGSPGHRRQSDPPTPAIGRVTVVEGVLRGGVVDIPPEGLTLQEVVARCTRPGATLAPSVYGGDLPAGALESVTLQSQGRALDLWYAIVVRSDTARIIPISLVSFSPLGSLQLSDRDVVFVESYVTLQGSATKWSGELVAEANLPVSVAANDGSVVTIKKILGQDRENLGSLRDAYAVVVRRYGSTVGLMYMPCELEFTLAENDSLVVLRRATVHRDLLSSTTQGEYPLPEACLPDAIADRPRLSQVIEQVLAGGRALRRATGL